MADPLGDSGLQIAFRAALSGRVALYQRHRLCQLEPYWCAVAAISGQGVYVFQPAMFAEVALMLWLVIKGARPQALAPAVVSSAGA